MNQDKSPLAWLGYFIVGLVVLLIAAQVLRGVLLLVYWAVTLVLSAAILVAVGYVVYLLLKSAANTHK